MDLLQANLSNLISISVDPLIAVIGLSVTLLSIFAYFFGILITYDKKGIGRPEKYIFGSTYLFVFALFPASMIYSVFKEWNWIVLRVGINWYSAGVLGCLIIVFLLMQAIKGETYNSDNTQKAARLFVINLVGFIPIFWALNEAYPITLIFLFFIAVMVVLSANAQKYGKLVF